LVREKPFRGENKP